MKAQKKIRIGVVFGGRSGESEISVLSAASVLAAIDREKYEPIPFAIDKSGAWYLVNIDMTGLEGLADSRIAALFDEARSVSLAEFDSMTDFAFPLLHGPWGEDGTIQGLFEMMGKPYAGCGVAASAISMDKIFAKDVWARAGLLTCAYTYTTRYSWGKGAASEVSRIEGVIPYPIFVKPANMGSSVGVSKVFCRAELEAAIETALAYDRRVIAEQCVIGREIEIGILGNETPQVSAVGEILFDTEYYDYTSKYQGGGAKLAIPADIPRVIRTAVETLGAAAYQALDGEGFARVDMFYNEDSGEIFLNEMNAIPGFTKYSMFPLLWEAKDVGYAELIERIIGLGYERYHAAHRR